jgi:hypothetical protein
MPCEIQGTEREGAGKMVERICPQCQYGNPLENRFCGRCGTNLEHPQATRHEGETGLTVHESALPVQFKQVGKAMIVSLCALAAEAGMAWLRQRVERMNQQPDGSHQTVPQTLPVRRLQRPGIPPAVPDQSPRNVTIVSHRVVENWEHGELTRQVVERTFWRREG